MIKLFGPVVVEEIVTDKLERAARDEASVWWKSNYNYLRSLVNGETPEEILKETLPSEDGEYRVHYLSEFEEYMAMDNRYHWLLAMHRDSPLAIGRLTRTPAAPAKTSPEPPEPAPPARQTPSAQAGDLFEIVEIDARQIGDNPFITEVAWKVKLKSSTSSNQSYRAQIRFLDEDEFVVHEDFEINLLLPANQEKVFSFKTAMTPAKSLSQNRLDGRYQY